MDLKFHRSSLGFVESVAVSSKKTFRLIGHGPIIVPCQCLGSSAALQTIVQLTTTSQQQLPRLHRSTSVPRIKCTASGNSSGHCIDLPGKSTNFRAAIMTLDHPQALLPSPNKLEYLHWRDTEADTRASRLDLTTTAFAISLQCLLRVRMTGE